MEQQAAATTEAESPDEKSLSTTRDMTDDELRAHTAAARARVKFVYPDLDEQPKREPVALADLVREKMPALLQTQENASGSIDMWEPVCVGCGAALGYFAKANSYAAGKTNCDGCSKENLAARLKVSGISYREMRQPLEALVRPSDDPLSAGLDAVALRARDAEFSRYLTFLRAFAALKPDQKIDPPFAFVYGSMGTGKSAGAERALRDAITNGCRGRTIKFSELVRMIYDTYRREQSSTKEFDNRDYRTEDVLRTYSGIHLLVVHEVGPDAESDHALSLFFDFVDHRHQAMLPTIFTSNYAPDNESLGARMGGRATDSVRVEGIIDRISGGVRENVFCLLGPSWRGREPQQ
jgi:DNA replication protein DnaC